MKKKLLMLMITATVIFSLCSCKKGKDELAEYKNNCKTFYEDISKEDLVITKISKDDPDYSKKLLKELDNLEKIFSDFANVPVPDDFAQAEYFANNARDNMSKAVELYHEAFESEPFNSSVAQNANDYYDEALESINYFGMILKGEDISANEVIDVTD